MLARAERICMEAHEGQLDKGGAPYYLHPFTVARNCETEEQKIVALLHDVMEDNPRYTPAYFIEQGFGSEIVEALVTITHREDESYDDYIGRIKTNALARAVKIQDLIHNSDLSRLKTVTEADLARAEKYKHYIEVLSKTE